VRTFGKYRLLELLASGGMAEVWLAEFAGPGGFAKEVALKLVRADLASEPELARLFAQEARLASRLGHANVVQVFEFDVLEGRHYLAMELVRGRTLRQVADRCRESGVRLGLARAVHVGAEVARALAYAHRLTDRGQPLGIVHRDVSPQNVLVSFEGEVKLADFGIARALGAAERTAPGTLKGKIAYMAPEQARAEPVDARADVFALGVVLWELFAGRRLFARDSEAATLAALLSAEPISRPSEWNEEVPADLDAAVLSALERDRERRTGSAEELLGALSAIRHRLGRGPGDLDLRDLMQRLWPEGWAPAPRGEPTLVRPAPEAPGADEAATRTLPGPAGRKGRRRVASAAGAVLAILLAAGAAAVWRGRGGEGRPTPGSASGPTAAPIPAGPAPALPTASPPPNSTGTPAGRPAGSSIPAGPRPTFPNATPPASPEASTGRPPGSPAPASTSLPEGTPASPVRAAGPIGSLPLPPRAGGDGILAVNATPWASVTIDGARAGDTPREWRLPAGRYRLRATHPARGAAEAELEVRAGQRRIWQPRLRP
jgi:serine/threonine-protein kinase